MAGEEEQLATALLCLDIAKARPIEPIDRQVGAGR